MSEEKNVTRVVVASMNPREKREWIETRRPKKARTRARRSSARRGARIFPKHLPALAAALCCLGVGAYATVREGSVGAVVDHLTAGFDYDETLGRLQFVSRILPESAMVFLTSGDEEPLFAKPTASEVLHAWSEQEPWLEYACSGDVCACAGGEVTAVVKNRGDSYTVRVQHDGGYESLYSGLVGVSLREGDLVSSGERIGEGNGNASFELRKGALAVEPTFAAL